MSLHFGVDVGTSSVRVALFDRSGLLIDHRVKEILVHHPQADFYEQSSENIWIAICECFHQILAESNPRIDPKRIKSIGFDATCSLVVLDSQFKPVTVDPLKKDDSLNVIMWMDHRAKKQAESINKTNHERLRSVGGSYHLIPFLKYFRKNLNDLFNKKS